MAREQIVTWKTVEVIVDGVAQSHRCAVYAPVEAAPEAESNPGPPSRIQRAFQSERKRDGTAEPGLLYPRRLIDTALFDSKHTVNGEPTDEALLARFWIAQLVGKPKPREQFLSDEMHALYLVAYREAFYGSFEWACDWLSIDVESERTKLLEEIDMALAKAWLENRRTQFAMQMQLIEESADEVDDDQQIALF